MMIYRADGLGPRCRARRRSAETSASAQAADYSHDHAAALTDGKTVAEGYFDDAQVQARPLSDWQGDWQSVYPHLDGRHARPGDEGQGGKG